MHRSRGDIPREQQNYLRRCSTGLQNCMQGLQASCRWLREHLVDWTKGGFGLLDAGDILVQFPNLSPVLVSCNAHQSVAPANATQLTKSLELFPAACAATMSPSGGGMVTVDPKASCVLTGAPSCMLGFDRVCRLRTCSTGHGWAVVSCRSIGQLLDSSPHAREWMCRQDCCFCAKAFTCWC